MLALESTLLVSVKLHLSCTVCAYITHRVLVQHIMSFSSQKNKVTWHIPSEYSKEMATKSDVVSVIAVLIMFDLKILQVPLGVLFFNENKTDENVLCIKRSVQICA